MNNNGYDVNQALQTIFQMKNAGRNPQQIMQMLMQQNPQIQQAMVILNNMSQGRNSRDFISQLAQQNGVSADNISQIMKMIGD